MPERRNKGKGLNKTEFASNFLAGFGNTLAGGLRRRSNNQAQCALMPGHIWNETTQECEPESGLSTLSSTEGQAGIPPITSTPGGGIQGGIEGAQPSPFEPFPAPQTILRILRTLGMGSQK
jgi:hypothetical protein